MAVGVCVCVHVPARSQQSASICADRHLRLWPRIRFVLATMAEKPMEGLKRKLEKIGPAKSRPKKALVKQAPALTLKQWALWLQWLCEHAGPGVYLAVFFTGALGLRCPKRLGLKCADICLDAAIPKIKITGEASGARKSPGDVYAAHETYASHLERWDTRLKIQKT